jgi:two-component system response regulator PilR (NtrC family)
LPLPNAAGIGAVWLHERIVHQRQLESEGLFEAAEGGTIFLDEIGETTPAMQVSCRVLQERGIRRVGGLEEIAVDVRVVAATNRDLSQMVEDGVP